MVLPGIQNDLCKPCKTGNEIFNTFCTHCNSEITEMKCEFAHNLTNKENLKILKCE